MIVRRCNSDGWKSVHNDTALVRSAFASEEINAPFRNYWAVVKKGDEVHPHQHPESEMVAVIDGRCIAIADEEEEELEKGDVVLFPPDCVHSMRSGTHEDTRLLVIKFSEP